MFLNINLKYSGFTLLMSLFILIVLALGANYVIQLGLLAQRTTVMTLLRQRAYYAADSGLEWGLYQALVSGSCVASTAVSFPSSGILSGFTAQVTCTSQNYLEGTDTHIVYTITSTGSHGVLGTVDFVSRQLSIIAST